MSLQLEPGISSKREAAPPIHRSVIVPANMQRSERYRVAQT